MSYVCFNPKCQYHVPIPESMEHYPELKVPVKDPEYKTLHTMGGHVAQQVVTSSGTVAVQRYRYETVYGDVYYLCDICHTAANFGNMLCGWSSNHGGKPNEWA